MQDYEKLGAFYLGRRVDEDSNELTDEPILYDSNDLSTHAVIIGMTGSGKTGLGIGLIEEAALDHVPVIAIDPKGDLGNLLLSFPRLKPEAFEPWVDPRAAAEAGQTTAEFAAATAATWKKGLAEWGQTSKRIENLHKAADFGIFTPGSSAGIGLSVLKEFAPPPAELNEDRELFSERVQSTVNSLLTLLGIDADPVTSREHILISSLLERHWTMGRSVDLASLIAAIQNPGFERIGVMDVDTFYPAKDRFTLAMRLNSLLAAPGFEAWMQGDPLDVGKLLYTSSGKPRVAVISIAHLNDAERMFFVTLLLGEFVTWMRRQSGSGSLRAILYMDEIMGYLPPVANPPSKQLFLTLLKQARAYGVGLVLATQNPVDLDYKALSNTGTWFIGRLQTERDQERVRQGLEGTSGSEHFDPDKLGATLAGLGKRRFLLHNVHEQAPVVFGTRWVMSYLAGPLTRDQIKRLAPERAELPPDADAGDRDVSPAPSKSVGLENISAAPPPLPPGIKQCYLPIEAHPDEQSRIVYRPRIVALVSLGYSQARLKVEAQANLALGVDIEEGPMGLDWELAEELTLQAADLESKPEPDSGFAELPGSMARPKNYATWERQLKRWLRTARPITIYKSPRYKEYSRPDESEADFRIRLQQLANAARDVNVAKLRQRYDQKVSRLEERLRRSEQAMEREAEQARGAKIDTALSFGTAVLGALLGRKRVSVTSAGRVGTAMRKAGSARKQAGDVRRAKETVESIHAQLEELKLAFDAEVDALDDAYDAQEESLTETLVRPKTTEIEIRFFGLAWVPTSEPR